MNKKLSEEAEKYMPGGVNSPVRAFKAAGAGSFFVSRADRAGIYSISGKAYIDYVMSWGALILGHAHPAIVKSVRETAGKGTSFGFTNQLEVNLAKMICGAIPSVEMIRFTNSGTEAVMSALRLARAYTGRKKIIKFAGCYHGHCDSMLASAGSGPASFGIPSAPGVTEEAAGNTIVCEYNSIDEVKRAFKKEKGKIAAVIIEPVAANMGVVTPESGFLEDLREFTLENGSLLIFDEVITGFRLTYGGYQNLIGVKPDITILGKIIGGGFPVGAYGGRRDLMKMISPSGPVYQAGTLSGNPVAMRAGLETLKILKKENPYPGLAAKAARLSGELKMLKKRNRLSISVGSIGSMFTVFFSGGKVKNFTQAKRSSGKKYRAFFNALLNRGILFPPSRYESCFISAAHGERELKKTLTAITDSLKKGG